NEVPGLLDQRAFCRREQRFGVRQRNRILELLAHGDELADIYVEVRDVARDANSDGCALGARDIPLAHSRAAHRERAPRVARHQELALDLLRHALSAPRASITAAPCARTLRTAPSPRRDAC